MTLDEAIKHARDKANEQKYYASFERGKHIQSCKKCAEEHEQLAEWLEELKVYQQHKFICNKGYNAGYNKAIDDFVRFANTMPTIESEDGEIRPMWLEEMAEQLKVGGNDDD